MTPIPAGLSANAGKLLPNAHVAVSASTLSFAPQSTASVSTAKTFTVTNQTGITSAVSLTVPTGYTAMTSCTDLLQVRRILHRQIVVQPREAWSDRGRSDHNPLPSRRKRYARVDRHRTWHWQITPQQVQREGLLTIEQAFSFAKCGEPLSPCKLHRRYVRATRVESKAVRCMPSEQRACICAGKCIEERSSDANGIFATFRGGRFASGIQVRIRSSFDR